MSLYGDKVTMTIGSGQDNLAQAAGTAVDNFVKGSSTAVDNLDYPITITDGTSDLDGDVGIIPGGGVNVVSAAGFPDEGDAYVKIGNNVIKFSYTDLIANVFQDCHSYDTQDYSIPIGSEVYLNPPRSL